MPGSTLVSHRQSVWIGDTPVTRFVSTDPVENT